MFLFFFFVQFSPISIFLFCFVWLSGRESPEGHILKAEIQAAPATVTWLSNSSRYANVPQLVIQLYEERDTLKSARWECAWSQYVTHFKLFINPLDIVI
jgi:hypothetical protein